MKKIVLLLCIGGLILTMVSCRTFSNYVNIRGDVTSTNYLVGQKIEIVDSAFVTSISQEKKGLDFPVAENSIYLSALAEAKKKYGDDVHLADYNISVNRKMYGYIPTSPYFGFATPFWGEKRAYLVSGRVVRIVK